MASDIISQIIELDVATPQGLKVVLRVNSLDLYDCINKITPENEIRLADIVPGFETLANKAKRAREFMAALSLEIDKEIFFHLLFITEREKKLSDLIEKIKAIERYEEQQFKLLSNQFTATYNIIEDEIIMQRKLFLDFLDSKIQMLNNIIDELDSQLSKLADNQKVTDESIQKLKESLSSDINRLIDDIIPQRNFILDFPFDDKNTNGDNPEKNKIIVNHSIIRNAFKNEAENLIDNNTSKHKVDKASFAHKVLQKIYNEHCDKNEIHRQNRLQLINNALNQESAQQFKNVINEHVDAFNENIITDRFAGKLNELRELQQASEENKDKIALVTDVREALIKEQLALLELKKNITHPDLSRLAEPNMPEISSSVDKRLTDLQAKVTDIKESHAIMPSAEDLLKNLMAQFDAQPTDDAATDNNPAAAERDPEPTQPQPRFTNKGLGLFSHRKSDREHRASKNDAAFEEKASKDDEVKKDKGEPDQEPPKLQ